MIPQTWKRELANQFIKRNDCKTILDTGTKEATAAGMMGDNAVIAKLAHLHERWKRSEQDFKMFLCNIAANPAWFDDVVIWMVDIQGNMEGDINEFRKPEVAEMASTDPESLKEKMIEVGGTQMREVWGLIKDEGYNLTDRQLVDDNRWFLGCQCCNEDANDLCEMIYGKYAEEIRMGVLSIRRMPWNLGIKRMTSVAEARYWLRKNPESSA